MTTCVDGKTMFLDGGNECTGEVSFSTVETVKSEIPENLSAGRPMQQPSDLQREAESYYDDLK